MPHVEDTWLRKDKTRKPRYGQGKRWRVTWTEPDGRRVTESFKTKDAAQAKVTSVDHRIRSGEYVPRAAADRTVSEYWPRFMASKAKVSAETRRNYEQQWRGHIEARWGGVKVRSITPSAARQWLVGLTNTYTGEPLSVASIQSAKIAFKGVLDVAVQDGVLGRNPVAGLDVGRRPEQERRYLDVGQVKALACAARPHHLMVWTLVFTGIRKGELFGLMGRDLDARRRRLRISRHVVNDGTVVAGTKGMSHRDVPVPDLLLRDLVKLAERSGPDGWLFPAPMGGHWTPSRWRTPWWKARAASGYADLDTHELRHTAASLAVRGGADVKMVQQMLGHKSAAITLDRYSHLWADGLDDVAERMAGLFVSTHMQHTPNAGGQGD